MREKETFTKLAAEYGHKLAPWLRSLAIVEARKMKEGECHGQGG